MTIVAVTVLRVTASLFTSVVFREAVSVLLKLLLNTVIPSSSVVIKKIAPWKAAGAGSLIKMPRGRAP